MKLVLDLYSDIFIGNGKSINKGENFIGGESDFTFFPPLFFSIIKRNINKILFIYKNSFLLPIPKDVFFYKENEEVFLGNYKLQLKDKKIFLKPNLEKKQKIKEKSGFLLDSKFIEYLKFGKINKKSKYYDFTDLFKVKIKPNIEIDRIKKTTKERMLFFKKVIEFDKNLKIYIDINNNNFIKEYVSIGGEASIGIINKIEKDFEIDKKTIKEKIKEKKHFKIILLTPTNYPPKIEGAERIAQLTGKPIAFSGWFNVYDEDKNKKIDSFPSRLFKLIPAGSVFYYKLEDESKLEEIFEKYWLKPAFFVPEYPYFEKTEDNTNPLGFGLSIIGVAQVEE